MRDIRRWTQTECELLRRKVLLYQIDGCVEDIEDKVDGTKELLADRIN